MSDEVSLGTDGHLLTKTKEWVKKRVWCIASPRVNSFPSIFSLALPHTDMHKHPHKGCLEETDDVFVCAKCEETPEQLW